MTEERDDSPADSSTRRAEKTAIAFLWEFPNLGEDEYHAGLAKLQLGDRPASGQIFHAAGPMDDGWWVYHVWESHPNRDDRLREKLELIMRDIGFPPPRATKVFQVRHVLR